MRSPRLVVITLLLMVWFAAFDAIAWVGQSGEQVNGTTAQRDIASLEQRANAGNANAAYLLGRMYMTGLEVPQNYEQAARRFQQSATRGLADAEFALGYLY